MTNKKFYNGKVIWITGASSGIGEALARQFSTFNCRLILSSNRPDDLERVKASLKKDIEEVYVLPLELSEASTLPGKVKEAENVFGRIDILINNGGISQRSLVLDTSLETDRKIMEINYFAGVILSKSILPGMVVRGYGHIAAVSSVTGKFGFPLRSAYSASKHAMCGFYETLGAEYYQQGIGTTLVFPGRVQTNISLGALGPDGKPQNIMDHGQETGIPATECAMDIINGIRKNRREVYSGGREIWMVYVKRFLPGLAYRLVRKVKRT
jgi:short-subunit dehydrogenase